MKILNQKSAYRILFPLLILLLGLLVGRVCHAQQNLDSIKAELNRIEHRTITERDIDRVLNLTKILLDSAQYDDLLRLYQFSLRHSRLLQYEQGEIISLAKVMGEHSALGAYESAIKVSDTLLLHTGLTDSLRKVALVTQGISYSHLSRFKKSTASLEEARTHQVRLINEMEIYDYLSFNYLGQGIYEKAIAYCFEALDILRLEQPEAYQYFSQFYHNLGLVHYKNDEPQKAREYYNQALDFNIKYEEEGKGTSDIQSPARFAQSKRIPIYIETGLVYRELNAPDSAKAYFSKAKRLSESLNGRNRGIQAAVIAINLAEVFNDQSQFDSALLELDPISGLFNEGPLQRYAQHVSYLATKGVSLRGLGRLNEALATMKRAEDKVKELEVEDENIIYDLYRTMSFTYEDLGQFNESLSYYKQAHAHRDSLYNQEKTKVIKDLEVKYRTAEKERAIIASEKEQARLKSRLVLAIVGGGLLLLLVLVLFRFYKVKRHDNWLLANKNLEINKKNEHLQELSKYKEGLTHMIAHDMKNPLNVVIGLADGEPDHRAIAQIKQSGEMMLQLISNMLDIQKFEEAKMPVERQHTNLCDLVEGASHQVKLLLDSKRMFIQNNVAVDQVVYADRAMVNRVLVNLFINAIKYSKTGEKIEVGSSVKKGRVHLTISDHGRGIPEEIQPYIFDKFWQSNVKAAGVAQSTGLGLTFCKLAIEAHQGTIELDSKLGEGSTFSFDLEHSSEPIKSQLAPSDLPISSAKRISTEEYALLKKPISEMSKMPLYQVSEIQRILRSIEEKSEVIKTWKEDIMMAVLAWDEQRYTDLLKIHQPQI